MTYTVKESDGKTLRTAQTKLLGEDSKIHGSKHAAVSRTTYDLNSLLLVKPHLEQTFSQQKRK